ncbi:MAG: pilus assembly protein PilM, partial [Planctomycetes bacterium]|nr:pilus assembly protein PilM [Planctomycetota bacterium]
MIERPILSIDWDVRTLRMVHAFVRKSSVRIDQVLSVAIPDDVDVNDAQSLGTLIRSALHKAGIGTKRALVDIPRHQANLYPLKLPRAGLEDLVQMVALQIPKELPFAVDQAAIDFAAPPETGAESCDVLVAAVLKDTLAFYRRVFEHAGLKLERVGLRPHASHVAVNALLEATPHRHVLFVDVGPTATEIDVLRDKRLVFSRAANVDVPAESDSVSLHVKPRKETETPESDEADDTAALKLNLSGGGSDSLGTDAVMAELLIEITRSIEAYRVTEAGAEMDHAVVGGSCDIEELLAD